MIESLKQAGHKANARFLAKLCAVFLVFLIGFFLLFSSYWLELNFEIQHFGQILFHLQFPLLDMDSMVVRSFIVNVVLPSVVNALLLSALPYFAGFLRSNFSALVGFCVAFVLLLILFLPIAMERIELHRFWLFVAFEKRVLFPSMLIALFTPYALTLWQHMSARYTIARYLAFALPLTTIVIGGAVANNKLHITQYIKSQAAPFSSFYESNYIAPEPSSFASSHTGAKPKQNLLIILAESLESTFITTTDSSAIASVRPHAKTGGGGTLRTLA